MRAEKFIANFDSASAMLAANGSYQKGESFSMVGTLNKEAVRPLGPTLNALPRAVRETLYIFGGWSEGISPRRTHRVRAEEISRWIVSQYPRRRYPAAVIGSSNGALTHLYAALGVPWLPQTVLIPIKHRQFDPDEPMQDFEWGKEPGRRLLEANPDLQLHHMHDPNQDRLMIQRMSYFRVKRLRLGATMERFLLESLPRGATLFLVDCRLKWPTVGVGERHLFQCGAFGGATPKEYLDGSRRVEEYLGRYQSHRRQWDYPPPDGERPEAEWGFEPALRDDVERFAQRHGFRVREIVFEQPEDASPLVADFYRWWYRRRRMIANRMLAETFMLLDPWWVLRTGSVPFWLVFNVESAAQAMEEYLDGTAPFDEIWMTLFSHGVECVGVPPIERWQSLISRATRQGRFLGVDEEAFPMDFGTFSRYYMDFKKIPARYPLPGPVSIDLLDRFLDERGDRYSVRLTQGRPRTAEFPNARVPAHAMLDVG